MEISSSTNANYSQITNQHNNLQNATQEEKDRAREVVVGAVAIDSKQSQIDAYVAGSSQDSDTSVSTSQEEYVQNYTDFASDARQADYYSTLVENGVDPSDIIDKPSTLPEIDPSQLDQEQKDTLRQTVVGVAGYQSTQSQIEAYKAGSGESDTSAYSDTADYIKNYNEFASDVRRSNAINTYIENSTLFGAS